MRSGLVVGDVRHPRRPQRLRKGDVVQAASIGQFSDLGGFRAGFGERPDPLVLRIWRNGGQGDLQMR